MAEKSVPIDSIYGSYRLALRALRKAGPQRAGARKQLALKQIADRYHVQISLVKQIVRELDEVHGITHEHDVNYYRELKFLEQADELLRVHGEREDCPHCGRIPSMKGDSIRVRLHPFPYAQGRLVPYLSCFLCYLELKSAA